MSVQQTDYNAGSNAELICRSNSIKSLPNQWQWYYNSKQISSINDQYIISNLTREHMGMYQCCSSDLNSCCAQTQIRVISMSCISFNDS